MTKAIRNWLYSIEWWLVERYDYSIMLHCDGCDKTRWNHSHEYLNIICKKCFENKCHACEIDCQEYLGDVDHESCIVCGNCAPEFIALKEELEQDE